jgi:hypothetical protein
MTEKSFKIDAIVVLPDHCHCIWQLPEGGQDFSGRWREIKKYVTKRIGRDGKRRGEKDIWQRRFWGHLICDENDWRRHMDYIHYITLTPFFAALGNSFIYGLLIHCKPRLVKMMCLLKSRLPAYIRPSGPDEVIRAFLSLSTFGFQRIYELNGL